MPDYLRRLLMSGILFMALWIIPDYVADYAGYSICMRVAIFAVGLLLALFAFFMLVVDPCLVQLVQSLRMGDEFTDWKCRNVRCKNYWVVVKDVPSGTEAKCTVCDGLLFPVDS